MPDHTPYSTPPDAQPRQTDGRHALRRAAVCVRDWWMRASAALERAERHIMENFRQPPHGG